MARIPELPCPTPSLLLAAMILLTACQSPPPMPPTHPTPWGPMTLNYSQHNEGRRVRITAKSQVSLDSSVRSAAHRYGFALGSGVKQTQWTGLTIHDLDQHIALPANLTRDLWQLDLLTARIDLEHSIRGLSGYQLFGSDCEHGYTVTFFVREGRCVGRLVSADRRLDFMEASPSARQ